MGLLERRGLMKTPATLLREAKRAHADLPDFRVSVEAPDLECAMLTYEVNTKEERDRIAAEEAALRIRQREAEEAQRKEWEEQRERDMAASRLRNMESRLVAERSGKAVVLKTADELALDREKERIRREMEVRERGYMMMPSATMVHHSVASVFYPNSHPYIDW